MSLIIEKKIEAIKEMTEILGNVKLNIGSENFKEAVNALIGNITNVNNTVSISIK